METVTKALLGRPLLMIALSSLGFSIQALFVKFLTTNTDFSAMEVVLFRGCAQASGVACVLSFCGWGDEGKLTTWLGKTRREVRRGRELCDVGPKPAATTHTAPPTRHRARQPSVPSGSACTRAQRRTTTNVLLSLAISRCGC